MKKFKLMVVAACFVFALAVPASGAIFSLDFWASKLGRDSKLLQRRHRQHG